MRPGCGSAVHVRATNILSIVKPRVYIEYCIVNQKIKRL